MSLTLVHVTGTFDSPDGTPANGTVTATLTEPLVNGSIEIPPTPVLGEVIDGQLEAKGGGEYKLYATDDVGTEPASAHYQFTVELENAPARGFYAKLPHAVSPVSIAALES